VLREYKGSLSILEIGNLDAKSSQFSDLGAQLRYARKTYLTECRQQQCRSWR